MRPHRISLREIGRQTQGEKSMKFDDLFQNKNPAVRGRGVHLDLKGVPPTADRLVSLLEIFAKARFNIVLAEWEDSFPWTVDERFRSPTVYTPEDIRRFSAVARDLKIEIIPLVQCLGHMETPLGTPGYEHLRELPDVSSGLNPLAPGARKLVQDMVDDVLRLMPETRRFHLGGDEAWTLGWHPDGKAYIEKHGKGALYLQHVEPILDNLGSRGVRPLLWHDMMVGWDDASLKALASKCDLVTWGYTGHPDTTEHHFNTKHIKRFKDNGFVLWGGTAYKGADGQNIDLPDIKKREENATAWMDVAKRFNYEGVIATAWSRYSTFTVQCEPIDSALDSLVDIGVILHDGLPPRGGTEACAAALEELGEKKRFEACKAAMLRLSNERRSLWWRVQALRENIALNRLDPRRNAKEILKDLERFRNAVEKTEELKIQIRSAFKGLMESVWVEEYIATRLDPLGDELAETERLIGELKKRQGGLRPPV
jgi:hypothetical protein